MEGKKIEFIDWLEGQQKDKLPLAVKDEIKLLLDLCKGDHWNVLLKHRESSVFIEFSLSAGLPKDLKDALTKRLFINRKVGRKLHEMEAML